MVPTRRRQVVGYRRVQGHATHRKSRRFGQIGQSGHISGVQFVGSGHIGNFLPDKSVLATTSVA